ncbi:MAG: HAMP domain-containing protein [Oscillospiraceae bacterium]|jgi:signal transduction histidine kinase|nr:HAMP domain-containing protein [Oscillospiraceae bacterium]MCI9550870.1 HAMP domain-containing protein [Oscillospiraceae bacterium]
MKTMYGRQFATMVGMVLLSFLMLGASFATLSYQYTIREKKDTLERNARYIAQFTSDSVESGGKLVWQTPAFQKYLSSVAKVSDSHVMVATPEGVIVYATSGSADLIEFQYAELSPATVASIVDGSRVGMDQLDGLYREPRYLVGLPITNDKGYLQGLVLVSASASNISGVWRDLSGILLVTALAVVLIAAIISSVTSMRQSQPIKEIAAAARQFGLGRLDVRVDVGSRRDEVGELAEAFNAMADSLAKSEQRRSEFIANVSHELKTPMTSIAGFADGILDGTIPPDQERHYLQIISSETRRLSRLVRSMLDLSRLQSDERAAQQQFDLCETLVRALVTLEGKVNAKRLEVDAQLPQDEPVPVWGDQDAITQVCYNLLDNAIKFSQEGGVLGLGVSVKGAKATVTISNQGETIPPGEQQLIFDRFHKTDHSRSADRDGVGLGLYIVKTILNSHKETISCVSEDGVTKFIFTMTRA